MNAINYLPQEDRTYFLCEGATVTLNKWYYEKEEAFVTIHYVGGEEYQIVGEWFDTEAEAKEWCLEANERADTWIHYYYAE